MIRVRVWNRSRTTGRVFLGRSGDLDGRHRPLPLDPPFRHQSLLGNVYTGRLVGKARIGERAAVVLEVSGTSWIYGVNTIVLNREDSFTEGFTVGDTKG
nr:proline racemase family protein [Paracoccus shandongensis]